MSKIEVDQDEHRALCDLRDGEHQRVVLRAKEFEEHYRACLKINELQVSRLTKQDLELTGTRTRVAALERENKRLNDELLTHKVAAAK